MSDVNDARRAGWTNLLQSALKSAPLRSTVFITCLGTLKGQRPKKINVEADNSEFYDAVFLNKNTLPDDKFDGLIVTALKLFFADPDAIFAKFLSKDLVYDNTDNGYILKIRGDDAVAAAYNQYKIFAFHSMDWAAIVRRPALQEVSFFGVPGPIADSAFSAFLQAIYGVKVNSTRRIFMRGKPTEFLKVSLSERTDSLSTGRISIPLEAETVNIRYKSAGNKRKATGSGQQQTKRAKTTGSLKKKAGTK